MADTSPIRTERPLLTFGGESPPVSQREAEPHPLSPRDTVPIIANGAVIERESLPPIGVRTIRPSSPQPVTASPLPITRIPTPVVEASPVASPRSIPTLDQLMTPHSVTMTPMRREPVRLLSTSRTPSSQIGANLSQTPRRVIYRVRRGQAQPRVLPLPHSITSDGRKNYAELSIDDQYRYQALILSRYNILRETNPWLNMPALDHSLTLDQKHDQYMIYYREVSIHNSANKYKQYLRLGFRLFELFGTYVLGLNVLKGYADAQETNITLYEDYLQQMAEKNYEVQASHWPLEVRLIVTALVQAALFAVISWVGSYLGGGQVGQVANSIMGMFGGRGSQRAPDTSGVPEPPRQEGFDLGSILNLAQGFLGGGSLPRQPAPRQPAFTE